MCEHCEVSNHNDETQQITAPTLVNAKAKEVVNKDNSARLLIWQTGIQNNQPIWVLMHLTKMLSTIAQTQQEDKRYVK